jgi:hypothetical protein
MKDINNNINKYTIKTYTMVDSNSYIPVWLPILHLYYSRDQWVYKGTAS